MIIYKITNKINGMTYVGQTKNTIDDRVACHLGNFTYLGKALRKYGLQSFDISVIDFAKTREELSEKEKYWIKILNCKAPGGYNLTAGGDGMFCPSEETRNKMSEAGRRRRGLYFRSEKAKKNISKALKGKTHSEEARKHMSLGALGRRHSEETKNKMRGKKHTEETKRKMSEKHKGFVFSEETIKKMRLKATGRKHSEETKNKLREIAKKYVFTEKQKNKMRIKASSEEARKHNSESHKGKKASAETKRKMSESQKRQWAEKKRFIKNY